jgi:hypothetical protein
VNDTSENIWKEAVVTQFKVLSHGGIEENHEIRQSGLRFETRTFRIRSRGVNHSNTTYGGAI